MKLESDIEGDVTAWAERNDILHLKLNVRGRRGWPDHIYLYSGRVCLIEFKRPDEEPEPLQVYVHELLLRRGFRVHIVSDVDHGKSVLMRELLGLK